MHDLKIKLSFAVCELCKRALMRIHCLTIAQRLEKNPKTKLTGSTDFKELHDKLCILTMEFSWAQALILGSALRSYMENEIRETSYEYKLGQELMAALSDYSDTHMADSVVKENLPAPVKEGLSPEAEEARRFASRTTNKRDDIFRGMVESVNVWGTIVTDTYIDPVARPNPGPFVHERSYSDAEERLYQECLREDARTRGPKPIADVECDKDLTNGEPIAFNDRMKKEGMEEIDNQLSKGKYPKHLNHAVGDVPKTIPVRGPADTVDESRKRGYIA